MFAYSGGSCILCLVKQYSQGKASCTHRRKDMHARTDRLCLSCGTAAARVGLLDVIVNTPVDVVENTVQCGGPHSGVSYPPAREHCSHTADTHT
jgi:hypothetical protein